MSGIPGFTPTSGASIPGFTPSGGSSIPGFKPAPAAPAAAPGGGGKYDAQKLSALWVQAGGKPEDADLMANVALNESSGDPNARNSYTEGGKTYHPTGLWQISDINGPGNYADPLENARKAVEMHRGSGMSPWEASRHEGGQGGWQKFLDARQSGHSEADFRDRGASTAHVAIPGFKPAPAPPSVAAAAFAGKENAPPSAAMSGMPTALQSQLHSTPQGNKTTSIPAATAQPAAGNMMKTVIDYAASPGALATAYARDRNWQAQQEKTLSGPALAAFKAKVRASHEDQGLNPGSPSGMFHALMQGKKLDPEAFPNSAALSKAFDGGKGLAPDKIKNIAALTTMVGPGKGSFEPMVKALTEGDKGARGVRPPESFGGAPLSLQTQSTGHSVQKNIPAATEKAGPLLDVGLDMLPQAFTPMGAARTTVKMAAMPLHALVGAMKNGDLMTSELPHLVASLRSTKTGEEALAHIVGASHGIQDLTSPFAAGRRVAKEKGVDPDLVEQHMRSYAGAGAKATDNADKMTRTIFANTTRAQRVEIERLSENLGPRGVVNPPKLTDPQGTLAQKAADLRLAYRDFTSDHVALKLLEDSEVFDPHTYTFRGNGAYQDEEIPKDLKEFIDAYKSGSQKTGANTNHKVFFTHDDAAPFLKDDYDPANQFLTYASKRGTEAGQERATRELQHLGIISDLPVLDPKEPTQIIGMGKEGAAAAARIGQRDSTALSTKDAFAQMNKMRAARGVPPASWTEFNGMVTANRARAKTRVRVQEAARQEQAMSRLAGKAETGATVQEQKIGDALKQQIDSKVAAVDKLKAKIDEMHLKAQQGDREAAAHSLATWVAERDKLELEIDDMKTRVQRTGEDVYGKPRSEPNKELDAATNAYHATVARFGPSSKEAEAAFKKLDGMKRVDEPRSFFEPVVGRIRDIYTAAHALPPGDARAAVLKSLGQIGKRGMKGPTKISDSVRAGRILKQVQQAMSHVAAAGRDTTSMNIIRELNKTAEQLTAAITRDDARLYAKKSAVASPAHRVADIALAGNAKAAERAKALTDKLDYAIDAQVDVDNFQRAFKQAQRIRSKGARETENILEKSQNEAARTLHQVAFRAVGATHGSPTLEFAMADKGIVNFFRSQGAPPMQATGIAKLADGMNRLARIGIITNPVVHAGWNLGTHFLAAGGPPEFFLRHAWEDPNEWGQLGSKTGAEWAAEADHWNAVVHMADTHPLFGGSYGKNMIDAPGSHDWKQSVNASASELWHQNQRIVFGQFENRYSVALFAHLVDREHMTPQAAGIAVRKALGDYANVSRDGVEGGLRKAFMFYPWFKTAIPFWAKTLVTRPGFVALPGMGVRRWNEDMGDPDMATANPLTLDFGSDGKGGRHKMTVPTPVKFVGDLVNALFPYDSNANPLISHLREPLKLVESHLKPWGFAGAFGAPVLETYLGKAQEPGGANREILFNKDESAGVEAKQAATHYASNLPFAGLAQGIAGSIKDPALAPMGITGGYQYVKPGKGEQIRNGRALGALDRKLKKAIHMPPAVAAALIKEARAAYERKTGQAAPANATPAVTIPGFTPAGPAGGGSNHTVQIPGFTPSGGL
jgi:hypothetical protein